jgi:6-phosphogluconate dehydrogenase
MAGGKDEGIKRAEPFLRSLAFNKDAYTHTGPSGSGHFVKLVHNGIEFGMLQVIGEGLDLMRKGGNGFHLDLVAIFKNWSNGSVIRGWLVELMEKGLRDQKFENVQSYIEIQEKLTGWYKML